MQARKNLIEHSFSVTFNLRLLVLNFTRAERAACLMDLLKGSQIKINPSPDCPPSMCTQFAQIIKQAMGSYIVQTQEDEVRKILDRAISDASLSQIYKLIHMCKVFKQQTQTRLKDKALRTKAAEEWSKMILQLEARKETLLDQASMLSAGFLVKVLGMFLLLLSSLVLSDPYKWTISLNFIEPSLVLGVFLIGASLALVVNRYKKFNNNQIYSMAPYLKEAEKLFAESICKKLSAVGNHMLDEIKKDEKAKDFRLDTKQVHPLIPVVNASHLPVQTVPAVTRSAQSKKRKNRNAEGSTSGSTIISETVSTQSIFAIDCSEKRLSKLLGNRQDLFRPFKSAIESTRERNYIGPKDSQKNGMKFFKPEKGYPTEIKIGSSGARLFCIKEVRDGIPTYIPTKFKAKHK